MSHLNTIIGLICRSFIDFPGEIDYIWSERVFFRVPDPLQTGEQTLE